jgi:hypothetical protein
MHHYHTEMFLLPTIDRNDAAPGKRESDGMRTQHSVMVVILSDKCPAMLPISC